MFVKKAKGLPKAAKIQSEKSKMRKGAPKKARTSMTHGKTGTGMSDKAKGSSMGAGHLGGGKKKHS